MNISMLEMGHPPPPVYWKNQDLEDKLNTDFHRNIVLKTILPGSDDYNTIWISIIFQKNACKVNVAKFIFKQIFTNNKVKGLSHKIFK